MSAAAATFYRWAYKAGGDHYFSIPVDVIRLLPPFWRTAAMEVCAALMILAREEKNFSPTAAEIAERLPSSRGQAKGSPPGHRCISFVQKGLHALDVLLRLIDRKRRGGRRLIDWAKGLRPSVDPGPASPAAPPGPPKEERRDTTTEEGSSSSPSILPRETGGRGEAPSPELVARACRLIPEATPEWVAAMVAVYNGEWFSRALDRVEEVNRTSGRKAVSRRYFVQKTLKNWADEGGPPKKVEPAPRRPAERPTAPEADPSREAREGRIREAWGLLSEPQREAIRAEIRAEMPSLARNPVTLEVLCLGRLGERMAAEEPRAP